MLLYAFLPFKNIWWKSYLTDNVSFSQKPIFYVFIKSSSIWLFSVYMTILEIRLAGQFEEETGSRVSSSESDVEWRWRTHKIPLITFM